MQNILETPEGQRALKNLAEQVERELLAEEVERKFLDQQLLCLMQVHDVPLTYTPGQSCTVSVSVAIHIPQVEKHLAKS